MPTFTGRLWYPLDARPEDFEIEDIAHHLAFGCGRYGGATRVTYTVAEHSIHVSRLVPEEYALEGLMHDASEAVVGDMIKQLKSLSVMLGFRTLEKTVSRTIYERFGVKSTPESAAAVHAADSGIVVDECLALLTNGACYLRSKGVTSEPLMNGLWDNHLRIEGFSPERAEVAFLLRYHELSL
jgi:hypothetical protein